MQFATDNSTEHNVHRRTLRGRGGVPDLGMGKIEFYAVSNRGGPQLSDAFNRIKNTSNYSTHRDF